ncbi:hypothetical protein SOVF_124720, partial [Spinacia oleracea]
PQILQTENANMIRVNNIEFEEVKIDLAKRQHLSQEFTGGLDSSTSGTL